MVFENSFWNSLSVLNLYRAENPEQELIQPIVARLVNELRPEFMLDFGCGDAYVERLIDSTINVDLFDKNIETLKLEHALLNRPRCKYISEENALPEKHYDAILLSFVLVCIEDQKDTENILRLLKRCKKDEGTLIVVNSHPCFLQYEFAAFKTAFSVDNFRYMDDGLPYEVSIKQPQGKPEIRFIDYHWTLSFWINKALKAGLRLMEMIEIPDRSHKDLAGNELYPPFLILKFI